MAQFEVLKKKCLDLLELVKRKNQDVCENIILSDLHKLEDDLNGRMRYDGKGNYIIDEKVELRILDGNLDIADNRGTTYGWLFEVEINGVNIGDSFKYKNQIYSVKRLNELTIPAWEEEIQKIIEKLLISKKALEEKNTENIQYSYYSAHEDLTCKSLNEVIKLVLERNPVIF